MVGTKLEQLLKERNMRVAELSRRTGISPSTLYSLIQRDTKGMDIDILLKICHALNVTPEVFGSPEVAHKQDPRKEDLMAKYSQLNNEGISLLIQRADELIQLGYNRVKNAEAI